MAIAGLNFENFAWTELMNVLGWYIAKSIMSVVGQQDQQRCSASIFGQ
jgi:hypothetical protein